MSPDELAHLIASRRSNLFIDETSIVSDEQLTHIVNMGQWAPNHKRTWPLRIAVIRGESRGGLGNVIADAMAGRGDDEAKVLKTRTKYMRSPVVLVVASARGESNTETEENKYAVAAGIQNMLLMAESMNLATLWGSPAKGANDAITQFCGLESTDHVMGLIYLGAPTKDAPAVDGPAVHVNFRN